MNRTLVAGTLALVLALLITPAGAMSIADPVTIADNNDADTDDPCQQDINEAQQYAEEQEICTDQFMEMVCPHDDSVTYGAPNGCEISALQERGWEEAQDQSTWQQLVSWLRSLWPF